MHNVNNEQWGNKVLREIWNVALTVIIWKPSRID